MIRPDDPAILEAGDDGVAIQTEASGCPFDHRALAAVAAESGGGVCPFPMARVGQRSPADMVVRKLLRIRDRPTGLSENAAYSTFQRSMLISAIRCTLTYVVFPFVLPAAGFATGVGPVVGITIGVVAITCDVFTIRRFFAVDHRWRWHFSAIAVAVICLLLVLMVQDMIHLLR
ncbi:MAG TPA: hypothetical protein VM282_01300 [Acidimicrobiales bacterium]|nr:hypothetical protein [Acidimicrobiales bacterium]